MAVFQKLVPVFNRGHKPVNVRFDGQEYTMQPGHDTIPDIAILFAQRQNPIMGSADPYNPNFDGAKYLVVREGEEGYGTPLTKEEWEKHLSSPSQYDEQRAFEDKYGSDPKAKLVVLGKGRKSTASSRGEAGGNPGGLANFTAKQ